MEKEKKMMTTARENCSPFRMSEMKTIKPRISGFVPPKKLVMILHSIA
jgi:hypothetical protein